MSRLTNLYIRCSDIVWHIPSSLLYQYTPSSLTLTPIYENRVFSISFMDLWEHSSLREYNCCNGQLLGMWVWPFQRHLISLPTYIIFHWWLENMKNRSKLDFNIIKWRNSALTLLSYECCLGICLEENFEIFRNQRIFTHFTTSSMHHFNSHFNTNTRKSCFSTYFIDLRVNCLR